MKYSHIVRNNKNNGKITDNNIIEWDNGYREVLPPKETVKIYRNNFRLYIQSRIKNDMLFSFLFNEALRLEKEVEDIRKKITHAEYKYYMEDSEVDIDMDLYKIRELLHYTIASLHREALHLRNCFDCCSNRYLVSMFEDILSM